MVDEIAGRVEQAKNTKRVDSADQKSSELAGGHVVFVELDSASIALS